MNLKVPLITEQIALRLHQGEFGRSGELFISVKALAAECSVSVDSAFQIMKTLAERRLIRLHGKRYYITTGYVPVQTSYGKLLASSRCKSTGMIVNRIESPFFSLITKELSRAAAYSGYSFYALWHDSGSLL